jgi:hypothetical protein
VPPPAPILSQLHPFHTPISHFLKIHLNIIIPSTPRFPKRPLSLRFRHQNFVYASSLPHTCYMPHPSHSSPFVHPNNATRKNDFVANLSDIASSWCEALTWASIECCRNSSSNAAEILSYKTHITAHSLTVTGVSILYWQRDDRYYEDDKRACEIFLSQ